jgi:hypothetical protein
LELTSCCVRVSGIFKGVDVEKDLCVEVFRVAEMLMAGLKDDLIGRGLRNRRDERRKAREQDMFIDGRGQAVRSYLR